MSNKSYVKQRLKNIVIKLMSIVRKMFEFINNHCSINGGKWKLQNTTLVLNSLFERKHMSFQSSLEAIRFMLMSECEWQRITCNGTVVGKRTLTM